MKQALFAILVMAFAGVSNAATAPLVCTGEKPIKLYVAFAFKGTPTHKEAIGTGSVVLCWDKDVDTEVEIQRIHDHIESAPRDTKVTILSVMKLRY